ncbi:Oxoglutarate/iron-dependent dioxygenase [Corchorus olitorius]|uniref:Oxoglutarate/iron-dependent dioxygenase n=1 Tax=Corchorus olitorius TaxID=93759 RepID=A0A1R3JZF3_9ROSI|nr:Oxoglutarate/iron-dependent dioxygenase [Corchorus olitorius]
MGSEAQFRLPVIDFSKQDLKPGSPEWDLVKSQVRKALEDYGCFEALFDKASLELRNAVFGGLKELFDLPLETKMLNVSDKPSHAYIAPHPNAPLYESIGIEEPNITENLESLANSFWPQGNASFSKSVQSIVAHVSELEQMVRRMILESFGLEKYMEEHMNSTRYLLRAMKYTAPHTIETKLGSRDHTDKNIVTVLCQGIEGLGIQLKDGEWISARPNSLTVMIGDSLYAWLNGRLHTPYHRVMMKGNKARYSFGLFSNPKGGYIIKAPEELVDEEHPLLFKPYDFEEFLRFFHSNAALKSQSAFKTYCSV